MMNDVVAMNNPAKPPSMHGFPTPISVADQSTSQAGQIVRFADVTVDVYRRRIIRGGEEVEVTPAEYNLLLLFVQNADRPLTRDAILNGAWGYDCYPNTRTVDAHVCKLRQKLESNPATPRHFVTIHRVGYRFLA